MTLERSCETPSRRYASCCTSVVSNAKNASHRSVSCYATGGNSYGPAFAARSAMHKNMTRPNNLFCTQKALYIIMKSKKPQVQLFNSVFIIISVCSAIHSQTTIQRKTHCMLIRSLEIHYDKHRTTL